MASLMVAICVYLVCCLTIKDLVRWPIMYYINEIEPFQEGGRNPTAEELARFFCEELSRELDDERVRICRVEVFETENSRAEYVP